MDTKFVFEDTTATVTATAMAAASASTTTTTTSTAITAKLPYYNVIVCLENKDIFN